MFKKKKPVENSRITVQAPPPTAVFSYYANRAERTGERRPLTAVQKTSGATSRLVYLPSIIALVVIIGCLVYATSLSMSPKIQINSSDGQQLLRDNAFYQEAGANLLKSSFLNRSKVTIDTAKLANQLETTYPELGEVAIVIPLMGRRPIIESSPAVPSLNLASTSGSFILDEQGRALVNTDDAISSLRDGLPNVIDESSLVFAIGNNVLPTASVNFISDLSRLLVSKQIEAQTITLPASPNELHLRAKGQTYYVKFDMQSDVRQQVGSFIAAKEKLETDKQSPSEYIDVRISEKVFYK